jgi:MFS family permease
MNPKGVYSEKGNKRFLALICFVASLGGVLFGFDTAVISGTFSFVESYFLLNKIQVGWFTSSALVGAIAGAAISGTLSDKYGRTPILILAAILFFISRRNWRWYGIGIGTDVYFGSCTPQNKRQTCCLVPAFHCNRNIVGLFFELDFIGDFPGKLRSFWKIRAFA